ncbi:hypothetical protein ACB094_01G020100 [Castanea mollissima]
MRLKLKAGTQSTSYRIRASKILTVPIWVTKAISPLDKFTCVFRVEVIEVKQETECTIWSVAPVSMIQSVDENISLLTSFAEKIECLKLELKDKPKAIPAIVSR